MNILITSAVDFEATPTVNALREAGIDCRYLAFGIGCLNSSAAAGKIESAAANSHVIYLGSCGVFGAFSAPYFVTADEVIWRPLGERLGLAYGIPGVTPDFRMDSHRQLYFRDIPKARVLCAPSISKDATLDPRDKNLALPVVENLELYSVLPFFLKNCSSFNVLLGVTNSIGANAHAEWKSNYEWVAQESALKIMEYIDENAFKE